ncbi:hypothetical protein [uncultured Parabacteroides sp.]|uniref:hypothetical protein n=1 Tax=uncultured Parabacteroides sp. TaxID=512312 RepID=UPI002633EACE|nr:hypothetical protein [uncultured Parabacteroides sp.]
MAEEFEIIRANLLPAAGTITDNDMILIIQGGRPKRALPSAMKGKQGDPGFSAFLGINDKYILWKQGANGAWQNLLEIEKIRGPKGEKPIFRKLNGTLQMKYESEPDSAYVDIFDREELKMKFSDLTPAEVDRLKLHFSDLTETDKAELMKPATDAAKEVREEMDVITGEANTLKTDLRQLEATVEEQEGVRENSYTQWQAKEQARQNDELKRKEEFGQIKTDAGTATESALAAAKKANDTNLAVEAAEQKRKDDEAKRIEQSEADKIAEQARKDAELVRQKQEEKREKDTAQAILDTNTAKQGAIEATTNAKSVSDHPGYIGSDYHVYTWDYVTGAYKKTDTILRPEGFSVYRTYASIAAMNADLANVPEGKFVLINTNDVEKPDNAKLYVRGAVSFEYLVDMSGAIGFTGKTPGFTVGTVTEGDAMNVTLSENGTDPDGNPLYKLNFVLRRGPQGFTPIIQTGTITTGLPGTNVSVEVIPNGQTEEGREKYLLNLTIPRGNPGTGNVSALGTGLVAGKMYLFVPTTNNSTEGAFVEYVVPDNFPEAPKDGKTYGRKDGAWSEVNSAGNMDGGTAFTVYGGSLVMDGGNAND